MATILISAPVVQIPSMTEAQRRKLSLRAPIVDPTGSSENWPNHERRKIKGQCDEGRNKATRQLLLRSDKDPFQIGKPRIIVASFSSASQSHLRDVRSVREIR